jgi:hypothetical protein
VANQRGCWRDVRTLASVALGVVAFLVDGTREDRSDVRSARRGIDKTRAPNPGCRLYIPSAGRRLESNERPRQPIQQWGGQSRQVDTPPMDEVPRRGESVAVIKS